MPHETKCCQCGKTIGEGKDFFKISAISNNDIASEKGFCSLQCVYDYSAAQKDNIHAKHSLEKEIKEAIEDKKELVEAGQKIAEQQKGVNEVMQKTEAYEKKELPKETTYKANVPESTYLQEKIPGTMYLQNQEFYIKNQADFDKINSELHQIKGQDSGMSRVDDSDLWIIEPETKKLKIRWMPRTVLDKLKEKQIILEYYKMP